MNKMGFNIKVVSDKFGDLINETFMDQTQFKIFLKMVHGALVLEEVSSMEIHSWFTSQVRS
jgi:hypothetical protein